jgi:chemotaxis signal transduction protein
LVITYKNSSRYHHLICNEARALIGFILDSVENLLQLPRISVIEEPTSESILRLRDKQTLLNEAIYTSVQAVDKVKQDNTVCLCVSLF